MLTLKLFLSSPADVAEERRLAIETVRALEDSPWLRERVNLVVLAWDDPVAAAPLDAGETPQKSINRWSGRPADCDLTIVVLWGRIGTPLPAQMRRPDGTRFESGTVWEVEDARAAQRPVFVYRRTDKPRIELDDPDFAAKRAQYDALQRWFDGLRDADGAWRAGVNEYASPAQFQTLLRAHLEAFIVRALAGAGPPPVLQASAAPTSAASPAGAPGTAASAAAPSTATPSTAPGRAPVQGPPPARRWLLPVGAGGALVALALAFGLRPGQSPERAAVPAAAGATGAAQPVPQGAGPQPVPALAPAPGVVPSGTSRVELPQVRLDGPAAVSFGTVRASTYSVLALEPELGSSQTWRLRVRVRLSAAPNSGGMNFWDSSFRLLVDGVPRAPVSNLNEIVESGAAKDGDVLFDVPWAVQSLVLAVRHYGETAELPLAVSGTRAPVPPSLPPGPRRVTLDGPAELSFAKSPRTTYTVLALASERRRPGVLGLRFRIRMHVLDGAGANFWDDRFRLLVDGVPRAPDSNLNLVVDAAAAKDGEITFEVPESARQLALRVVHTADAFADLPLKLD